MNRCRTAKVVLLALALPVLVAGPADASTLERTLVPQAGAGGVRLVEQRGERHVVRRAPAARLSASRRDRRRSLVYFAHLTDLHIADELSPARHEYLAPAGGGFSGFWRPHEAFGPHVVDQVVRAVNRHRTSELPSAGGRARLGFALVTGDLADNAQRNEVRWAVRTLDGGRIDPHSGQRLTARNSCGVSPAVRRRLNRALAQRRYTGVQGAGPRFPRLGARWPGALDRAQRPYVASGLAVPWYSVRGNHDALPQGHYGPATVRPRSLPTGCRKVFPGRGLGSPAERRDPWALTRGLLPSARPVAPDSRRRFLASAAEFRRLHGHRDRGHGFALTAAGERARSHGSALYYAWSPRPGLRFVALDTTADAGGAVGNVDHPQYLWLARELRRAERRNQLVVVYGHHPLGTIVGLSHDELGGAFDRDPRDSRPLHLGRSGPASLRSLLLRHRNVLLYVTGHNHYNRIWPNFRRDGSGFWEVVTASLVGAPQQARLLELMDNRDGTLSILTTMVDHAAPPAPRGGRSAGDTADLAAISRIVAWSRRPVRAGRPAATSRRKMRNVELVLRDPRRR